MSKIKVNIPGKAYELKPGSYYVFEVNEQIVARKTIADLWKWLDEQGIKAYFFPKANEQNALTPVPEAPESNPKRSEAK